MAKNFNAVKILHGIRGPAKKKAGYVPA